MATKINEAKEFLLKYVIQWEENALSCLSDTALLKTESGESYSNYNHCSNQTHNYQAIYFSFSAAERASFVEGP